MRLFRNEKFLYFIGGIATVLTGIYAVKSGKARQACVKGLATGMQIQKKALVTFKNIQEEAVDLCHDAALAEQNGAEG